MIVDPLAGLIEMVRREAAAAALEAVRLEILRCKQAMTDAPRIMSIAALGRRYGIGRKEVRRLIAENLLPCIERRCRGGRIGIFVAIEDAEMVLAGKIKS